MLGCGVVGTGILELLKKNAQTIEARLGVPIDVTRIAVKDASRARESVVPGSLLTTDPRGVVDAEDVDVVVEVMGGVDAAGELLMAALENGKHVVTANKALIAERGDSLIALAEERGVDLYFEAAVAGGIPIIRVLREALASDRVVALRGIVNGTSNYILSRMYREGLGFAEALKGAQEAGYAEADPTLDVSGGDACHKLAILATLAWGVRVRPDQIATEGIDQIDAVDMMFAERFGYVIKPLAVARETESGDLDLRVHPALVEKGSVLASITGALNAVYLEGAMLGPCLLSGPGAGALPTAMSVVSDIVDVARNTIAKAHARVPSRSVLSAQMRVRDVQDIGANRCRFYLRFSVHDQPGVLARIAGVLGAFDVSIEQMVQEGRGGDDEVVTVVMLTHDAREKDLKDALREIDRLSPIASPTVAVRIES